MTLLVIDGVGHGDTFTLTTMSGNSGQVTADGPNAAAQTLYSPGARVTQVVHRTYYLKRNGGNGAAQLVFDEAPDHTAVPLVDHVVGVSFEYYGDRQPPALTRPIDDPIGPWTTYGPPPPPSGLKPTGYPEGENCAFARDPVSGSPISRLSPIGTEPEQRSLVRLTMAELSDGDLWCPDAETPSRFDADLLRVRKIAVMLRIESAVDALRGPAGALFTRGGTAREGRRFLPDREIRFEVTPPNLNLGESP
jgi:hypothetical protein